VYSVRSDGALMTALACQKNEYGDNRQWEVLVHSSGAGDLARSIKADREVTNGICIGLFCGEPLFGDIGELFLREKIPDAGLDGLGVALVKTMTCGLSYERVSVIIKSVEKLLRGGEAETQEEKAAMAIYTLRKATRNLKLQGPYYSGYAAILERATEEEQIVLPTAEDLAGWSMGAETRERIEPSQEKAALLEEKFQYYKANKQEMSARFWEALSDYPEDAVIAYYVMLLPLT
jgi:hypothetical protein